MGPEQLAESGCGSVLLNEGQLAVGVSQNWAFCTWAHRPSTSFSVGTESAIGALHSDRGIPA